MNSIFINIFNNSLVASVVIAAVLVVRVLMKKAPKWVNGILWGIVAIKLVCPFSIKSIFSLIPSEKPIPADIEYMTTPAVDTGIQRIDSGINQTLVDLSPVPAESVNPMQVVVSTAAVVWVIGIVLMLLYYAVSVLRIRYRLKASNRLEDNIYECEAINSPFIFGLIRPRIYLPVKMNEAAFDCVVDHERTHIKRKDYLWKPIAFIILTVYWFNPLCWIAYILLCKDIELACDERVIKDKDKEWKTSYCQTLLDYGVSRKMITSCPVAFGEVSVKDRVKSVLNYKKPAFWIICVSLVACIVVAVCFLTDPKDSKPDAAETVEENVNQNETVNSSWNNEDIVNTANTGIGSEEAEFYTYRFFSDIDGNKLEFKVIDSFTAYERNTTVLSKTIEIKPNDEELLEFTAFDGNEWARFKYGDQIGWVRFKQTDDPWVGSYFLDAEGNVFPMRAVVLSTKEIKETGWFETSERLINNVLHDCNIDTDFDVLLNANVIKGEEVADGQYDVYIKEIGRMDYFYNLHVYNIENRYGDFRNQPNTKMMVFALFDRTDTYLMDVKYYFGERFEVQTLDIDGLPAMLFKIYTLDNNGDEKPAETGLLYTSTTFDIYNAYELEADKQYGVIVPAGRGTGFSVDYLHVLTLRENGEASILAANNKELIKEISSKFNISVLTGMTTEDGSQILDIEFTDDIVNHVTVGLGRNDLTYEYAHWNEQIFYEYDEANNRMYFICCPNLYLKIADNGAVMSDCVCSPYVTAKLNIQKDGTVSIADMSWTVDATKIYSKDASDLLNIIVNQSQDLQFITKSFNVKTEGIATKKYGNNILAVCMFSQEYVDMKTVYIYAFCLDSDYNIIETQGYGGQSATFYVNDKNDIIIHFYDTSQGWNCYMDGAITIKDGHIQFPEQRIIE